MSQLNQQLIIDYKFIPEYSFNNFIKSPSTEMAYSAALSITRKSGPKYNPLCIYGEKGVGKTHLLRAIGNEIRSKTEEAVIIYIDSKNILAELEKTKNEFDAISLVKKYMNVDFLIIDDIDVILRSPSIDEKIFHLYNHLIQRGKQFIFSSSTAPNQLEIADQNLKSRLKSGLAVKTEQLRDEDKRKVLKKLAKDFDVFIPDNVIDYILNSAPRDFISLHNVISQINRLSLETKKKITLPLVKKALET